MSQTLHIFKKDMRCFWMHIVLVFLSAILSVSRATDPHRGISPLGTVSAIFWIAGTLLISMVIHAEAIPGSKLHWLTRPYQWKSLLAAKLFFLFLFAALPPVLVAFVFLVRAGFSPAEFLPLLLFRALLLFLAWVVPVAALAAVTDGLTPFLAGLLFAAAASFGLSGLLCCSPIPIPSEWIPVSFAMLILFCGAAAVLLVQYRRRRTEVGRACIVASVIVAVVVLMLMPFTLGMQVQRLFSQSNVDHSSLTVSINNKLVSGDSGRGFYLDLKGIPAGFEPGVDAIVGRVLAGDGSAAVLSPDNIVSASTDTLGNRRFLANLTDADITGLRGKTVTVKGSAFVTLSTFRSWQQSVSETHQAVVDGVRCGQIKSGVPFGPVFSCRAMLNSPPGMLHIQPAGAGSSWWALGSRSYAPLPGLSLRPLEEVFLNGPVRRSEQPRQATPLEFRYSKPVSHFWLNFDIPVARFLE
jgi:hypothetical protein